jgi:hypothetical protein
MKKTSLNKVQIQAASIFSEVLILTIQQSNVGKSLLPKPYLMLLLHHAGYV